MMAQLLLYRLLIPVSLLAALCSDTGINSKFVCIGNTVQVFQNIMSPNYKLDITFYKTFDGNTETIAEWSMQNVSAADIHYKYKKKVSLENGTILIWDFQKSDEAMYTMLYNTKFEAETQLQAIAPPTKRCKAYIRQEEHFLIASLNNPEYCGTPPAYVHWMKYPESLQMAGTIIKVPPRTEAITYRACIEGEALKCMKDSAEWNNCENYTISSVKGNDSPTTFSAIPQTNIIGIVTIVIVSLVLIIVSVSLYILYRKIGLVHKKIERKQKQIQMRNRPLLPPENVPDGIEEADDDLSTTDGGEERDHEETTV